MLRSHPRVGGWSPIPELWTSEMTHNQSDEPLTEANTLGRLGRQPGKRREVHSSDGRQLLRRCPRGSRKLWRFPMRSRIESWKI